MKKSILLLFVLLVSSSFAFCQVKKDSLAVNYIYAPNSYEGFTPKESWEIHKAAYIKQLKTKGLSDKEYNQSLADYEKQKEEFIAQVKEQQRIAEIQRKKAEEQRAVAAIERKKAEELREQADKFREQAEEFREQAETLRKNAEEQRENSAVQREKADELRKQAEIQRAKAVEQRKLADAQREKAEELREKMQEWRKDAEIILSENVNLSNLSSNSEPIIFKVTEKGTLHIGIRAQLSSGITLIEIYNPSGVKEGELSLDSKSESGSNKNKQEQKYTTGSLDKTISNAATGDWQIKISSQKSSGNVAMSVAQQVKSSMNE